ncbi:signal peptidase I [Salinibaculum salinum]|uniref:signal peptidase I n=1 Tax=Salinibaculum salinum TaxID=3131996 RepID=UPI0030EB210C
MSDAIETEVEDDEPLHARIPWRRIVSVAGVLVLVAIVVPFIIYTVPQVAGGEQSYVVLSGSMEPNIGTGDVIITDGVEPDRIESGDVITYRRSGDTRPTTHRVIEVVDREDGLAFRTQGDANEDPDQQLVPSEEVEGTVMTVGGYLFVIPFLGYVITFASSQTGIIALLVVPLLLFIISEIWVMVQSAQTESAVKVDDVDENESDDTGTRTELIDSETDKTTEEPASTEAETQVTFTSPELQLGLIVLSIFVVYSFWVAYITLEVWAFAVAGSVTTAFLLLGAVYLFGDGGEEETASPTTQAETLSDLDTEGLELLFGDADDSSLMDTDGVDDDRSHISAESVSSSTTTEAAGGASILNHDEATEEGLDD